MNKIFLSGNLTRAPEINYYQSTSVAKFGLAVNRPFSKNNEVDFFNVVAFGKTAEFCSKYFDKGRRAIIEGRLQTSTYTDKDGVKRTSYDVIVDNIEFGDTKKKEVTNDSDEQEDLSDLPF